MTTPTYVGYQHPAFQVQVTAQNLGDFNLAIAATPEPGQEHLAPPTYMKVIEGEHGSSRAMLEALNIELRRVLHAEQSFEYFLPIRVGDVLEVVRSVSDHYTKKGGTMEFLVIESRISRTDQQLVGRSEQILLLRNI